MLTILIVFNLIQLSTLGRVGRVGQWSGGGRVITYVSRPYQVEVVQEIERSVRLHRPLMGVDSNIKRQLIEHEEVKRAEEYEKMVKAEDKELRKT